jgi:tetratricopeptide (TPR) repeat protein
MGEKDSMRTPPALRQDAQGAAPPRCLATQSGPGHCFLGHVAVAAECWEEAIARLTRPIQIDPDHDAPWLALGYVYQTRNQPDTAVAVYKQAGMANPDNPVFIERPSKIEPEQRLDPQLDPRDTDS